MKAIRFGSTLNKQFNNKFLSSYFNFACKNKYDK
jgi:hypothetical protein